MSVNRRHFLAGGLAGAAALAACRPANAPQAIEGGFVGVALERGHRLRDLLQSGAALPPPARIHRTQVVIAGGGVAGLAASRALRQRGVEDFALLELEDTAGGNSRGGITGGMACPLGAHYLPVPGDDAPEVQDFLEELGLRQRIAGRWHYDERHLCHSPQERLYFQGTWQEGLLPTQDVDSTTLAQYRKFAVLVQQLRQAARWTVPVRHNANTALHAQLATLTFKAYLEQNGLDDPHLGWYLDYCCRDEYGAGSATVSAWAGAHYFASRHGFHAPGADTGERDSVLTWPEGNGWLTQRLAQPLGERLRSGRTVVRIATTRDGVEVDALDAHTGELERWVPTFAEAGFHKSTGVVVGLSGGMRLWLQVVRTSPVRVPAESSQTAGSPEAS
jgi:predicted NAD/FAD-binding protein